MRRRLLGWTLLVVLAGTATSLPVSFGSDHAVSAADNAFKSVVILPIAGIADQSFGAAILRGVERFQAETGVPVTLIQPTPDDLEKPLIERAMSVGPDLVILGEPSYIGTLSTVAWANPDRHFAVIDQVLDVPNVKSLTFREHEGAYLVGYAAGLKTKAGIVGFIGGMDMPVIRRFACGFKQGVLAARPNATVLDANLGSTRDAFSSIARGRSMAVAQYESGADIIFHAAGGSGLGVIKAAEALDRLAIGVDLNQNGIAPGTVLTSMLKRLDVAVYLALKAANRGHFRGGRTVSLGLADDAIDWAYDVHNASLIPAESYRAIEERKLDIITGRIVVHNHTDTGDCPL